MQGRPKINPAMMMLAALTGGFSNLLTLTRRAPLSLKDDLMRPLRAPDMTVRIRGQRYPEQSDRQALRAFRRAQGGPGLTEGRDPQPRSI